jgi:hypothetical protein
MARPADLPFTEHFQQMPCGTRAKYVGGACRCRQCRIANGRLYHDRQSRAIAAAEELPERPTTPAPQIWTAPDGTKRIRLYKRACPGVNGEPCAWSRHLRKDSKGGVCGDCRLKLAWNGLVDAAPARAHVRKLSRQGVGYKAVADAASVARTIVAKIRSGDKTQLRAETAKRILAVDRHAVSGGALVKAGPTTALLRELLREGFTKSELARRLGSKAKEPSLQITARNGFITARTAAKVERFYRRIMAGA